MATKRRRRRKTVARANPPKRRRRRRARTNPGAFAPVRRAATNPPRRRRRHAVARSRRRARRNPPAFLTSGRGGLVGGIVQGLKDGGAVVVGQVGARKVRGAITGMLPATTQTTVKSGVGFIGLSIASAAVVSLAARKVAPSQARLITAGAFSEIINAALAQTPIAPYLSAFPARGRTVHGILPPGRVAGIAPGSASARTLRAWPDARVGMSAWPSMRSAGVNVGGI